eukprot:CAMPEP_0201717450 /NCGR_PEP_ID=MMETSP0593-20130828/3179_1 /ASSEMBLY_ACC=CAM_ASM_000672 /TAXON_ID=267983 /ORGANISM="Skeletonema japonicum, Strain CCMP2506" /LENGTH=247 /DNA_ID=CAMNT_0048207507 /DNA_START=239 /DNA_END=982 /DNA_ORIENTATION=-
MHASLAERANANEAAEAKIRRRSRGGQYSPKEPGKESDTDSFETKLRATAITKRRVKGSQEQVMVDFKERRHRRQSEKLVVEFPSDSARARRAHRMKTALMTKGSSKPCLKNSIRTIDTEVSFEDVTKAPNSSSDKKMDEKKGKGKILGDFTDKFDWSESSIVWGDEGCSFDEESPHGVCGFTSAKDTSEVNFTASNLFRKSSRRSIASSRSLISADLSFRSAKSRRSATQWQSFPKLNVSRKKLEP